ncbi:MAG: DUF11 domain-containing protein, partial [Woeseiaceae bacterium]|jgi:uncharacterized repeat protein (TIGR01451 family)|nr:DUF11 domain-containing protein [Woeseiaceae bacterium]
MIRDGSVGIPNSLEASNAYNCAPPTGEPGAMSVWQFKRVGGGIAAGPGGAVFFFDESEHGPGSGGGGGDSHKPDNPGGDEGEETEGGITAVEFERIAMINNQAGSDGGALLAAAEMTITDSVFSGNLSAANGGAIYIDSATTIFGTLIGTSSTDVPFESGALSAELVSVPNRGENGGGIFDTGFHTTNIESSAINGNEAIGGGGIAARSLIVVNITNSTISGNTGTDVGGGITTNGTVNLRNVTVADNVATTDAPGGGGGLNSFGGGTYTFYNTILSNNVVAGAEAEREANCGCSGGAAACPDGRMISLGYNVSDEAVDTCSMLALGDQVATDPLLEPLTNNGGLTETHALPSTAKMMQDPVTSPAIDRGDNTRCSNNDQRGSLRPDDGDGDRNYDCDVGAFELFIPRADLHINNVTIPNQVRKGQEFDVTVEVHNDDFNSVAPSVEFTATLDNEVDGKILAVVPTAGSCDAPTHTVTCALGDLAVGEIATVNLRVVGVKQGDYAFESLVATDGVVDPVPENNIVTSTFFALGDADIAVTGNPVPDTVDQGDTIVFGYTVINNGEDDASAVRLGMVVPTSASFVSATSTTGSCAESDGEVLCNIGALGIGESAVIEIQLVADEAGVFDYTAIAGADQVDPDDSNNTVTATITAIANADLELTGTGPGNIVVGREYDLTLTVTNAGPQDASNILLTAPVPTQASVVSATGCDVVDGVLECTSDALAVDESVSFAIRFSADRTGTATVSAAVVADENDPDTTNNEVSVAVAINPQIVENLGGGGGGGGCVYNPDTPADSTLPLMLLTALLALGVRHRMFV